MPTPSSAWPISKGHELAGFGGTIKNVGMGCASREGKLSQHSNIAPKVTRKKCIGCGECVSHCAQSAIALEDEKSVINPETCVGCGECILTCPQGAIQIQWNESIPIFQQKMVEYTGRGLKRQGGPVPVPEFFDGYLPGLRLLRPCRPAHRPGHRHPGLHRPGGPRPGLGRSGQPGAGKPGFRLDQEFQTPGKISSAGSTLKSTGKCSWPMPRKSAWGRASTS